MCFEVEMKFPRSEGDALETRLGALGLRAAEQRFEADRYFNAPHRDFALTDEALRLRQVGDRCIMTYKGPKQGSTGKTRLELEAPLAATSDAPAAMAQLLTALGFRETAVVRKRRSVFRTDSGSSLPTDLEVCLDDVEGVGSYVELERKAKPAEAAKVQAELQQLARALGLGQEERRSYLELLLLAANAKGPR